MIITMRINFFINLGKGNLDLIGHCIAIISSISCIISTCIWVSNNDAISYIFPAIIEWWAIMNALHRRQVEFDGFFRTPLITAAPQVCTLMTLPKGRKGGGEAIWHLMAPKWCRQSCSWNERGIKIKLNGRKWRMEIQQKWESKSMHEAKLENSEQTAWSCAAEWWSIFWSVAYIWHIIYSIICHKDQWHKNYMLYIIGKFNM